MLGNQSVLPPASDALLENAFNHSSVGMALVGTDGRWLRVNAALCRLLGYPMEDLLATQFQKITHPENLAADVEAAGRLLKGEIACYETEKRYIRQDGDEVPALVNVSVVRDADGTPACFYTLVQPVGGGHDEAAVSYQRERALLTSLMENSPDYIYFKDVNSRIIRVNRAKARRHNLSHPDEAIGATDFDFFDEESARKIFAEEKHILETGEPLIGSEQFLTWPDGKTSWVSTTKVAHRDDQGRIIGLIGISRDITAQKTAETERERLNRELIEASRRAGMSEVASSVLHNVGNVLNSVNISCSVISQKLRRSRIGTVAKTAEVLEQNRDHLAEFVAETEQGRALPSFLRKLADRLAREQTELLAELELLDRNIEHISQIITVQQNYANVGGVQEEVRLVDLVEDALRMNSMAMARHRIEVIREYAEVPPVMVEKHKVLQILVNLIRNAKHALTDGENTERYLTLRIEQADPGSARIVVRDSGLGISAENLTKIFSHGFTTKAGGHGFGLHSGAIAAKEMGGSLTASSDGPGTGAAFTLVLPIQPDPQTPYDPYPLKNSTGGSPPHPDR